LLFLAQNAPETAWRPGSTRTRWGSLSAPTDSLAAVKGLGPPGRGRGKGKEGRRGGANREGREEKGRERRGGKGRRDGKRGKGRGARRGREEEEEEDFA